MASWISRGGKIFLTSTRLILIPHGLVASSKIERIFELIISLDVNVWSNSNSPIMFLRVVAVKFSMALTGLSTPYVYSFGSVI